MKEYHIAVVTRNIEKASGSTSFEKTAKVSSQTLMGSVYFKAESLYDGEYPLPAYPPFGFASLNGAGDFWVPKVGDNILVEIDDSIDLPDPRYICCLYTNVRTIHRDFRKNYPYRLGKVTNSGHKLIYDDKSGEETINFEHTFGQRLFFDKDGSISIKSRKVTKRDDKDELKDGVASEFGELYIDLNEIKLYDHRINYIKLNSDGVKVEDKNGNKTTHDATGINFQDKNGNKMIMDASGIKLEDKNGNKVTMSAAGINIDSASQHVIIDGSKYELHRHVGNLGIPTDVPIDAASD